MELLYMQSQVNTKQYQSENLAYIVEILSLIFLPVLEMWQNFKNPNSEEIQLTKVRDNLNGFHNFIKSIIINWHLK